MTTPPFAPIIEAARARLGAAALETRLPQPRSAAELKAMPDDRYLSQMSLQDFPGRSEAQRRRRQMAAL